MKTHDLSPAAVAARLTEVAHLYVPETIDEARERLRRERPPPTETFEEAVHRRLAEVRAINALVRYLHRRR